MDNPFSIELDQEHLEYILAGLELYCLNLNHVWVKQDLELKEEKYANVFYLYHRLLNLSTEYKVCSRMVKPKRKSSNVVNFLKNGG